MRNIIIVEAVSTGYNLVEDVIRRGYHPVVLECPGEIEYINHMRKGAYEMFLSKPEIIRASEQYEETLEMVRTYNPLLIVPG